jgi:hypothetical protein
MQQNALAGFAMNPGDPNAQGAAARYDPGAVMQYRQGQQSAQAQLSQEQIQTWHHYAASLAKWADTPQKWDQAIDYLLQSNHPDISTQALMQLKGHFDPALRQSFMAMGGQQDDNPNGSQVVVTPQPGAPAFIYDKSTGQTKQIFAPNDGSHPAGAPVQDIPAVATPQDAMKLPPGTQFRLPDGRIGTVPGGAGGNASGGFPQ